VEENRGSANTFKSYMRVLVSFDASKPLNLGFDITKDDGSSTWISLKYERLDVYCTDCGRIGDKQPSCLAKLKEKFPSRYLISLRVTLFSNLPAPRNVVNHPVRNTPASSSQTILPKPPYSQSSQPQAIQPNIFTSSQNSLTPQTPTLWSYNPTPAPSPISPCPHHPPSVVIMDSNIESNLKSLSLFQKPIKLYTSTTKTLNRIAPQKPLFGFQLVSYSSVGAYYLCP
jgi:hypothetical protein